jgi:hypothetical protein
MSCVVSASEVVARAHAQVQVVAVNIHTLYPAFTFYPDFLFAACRFTQTPTSKWCGLSILTLCIILHVIMLRVGSLCFCIAIRRAMCPIA